jgi:hypothetical protein
MTPWTELFLSDWRTVLPMMKRLGIKGGFDHHAKRTNPKPELSAASIAEDGQLMVERGPIAEHWGPDGLIGVHLLWDHKTGTIEQLAEMMSVDAPYYSGLTAAQSSQVMDLFVPGQRRTVVLVCPGTSEDGFWSSLYKLVDLTGQACDLHYMSRLRGFEMGSQYSKMFGGLFRSATLNLTTEEIIAPNGFRVSVEKAWERRGLEEWTKLVGFDLEQLTMDGPLGSRNRKALSVASGFWASRNWNTSIPHLTEPPEDPAWAEQIARMGASPELLVTVKPARLAIKKQRGVSPEPSLGDMIACNACTLFDQCRLARAGAICAIPESDMGELATFFKTRDTSKIIEGLGELLGRQADRVEQRMADEERARDDDDQIIISEDVTKMIHGLFDRGVKLAKLTDPSLNGGPSVSVNVAQQSVGAIQQASPQQLAAGVVAELEARGVRREDITMEVIEAYLSGDQNAAAELVSPPMLGILPEAPQ